MSTEESCAVAHGDAPAPTLTRTLVAVFASPVAECLIRYGNDLGYRTVLVDPERARIGATEATQVLTAMPELDELTDVVVTDHHRVELGLVLRDALAHPARWIGVMGNPRHPAPYLESSASWEFRRSTSSAYTGRSGSTSGQGPHPRSPSPRWPGCWRIATGARAASSSEAPGLESNVTLLSF